MNIYKINFSHHAPKGAECGIKCLLLAENDEQVYEWIKQEPEVDGETLYNNWETNEVDDAEFKQKIISIKGEMFDDEYDYSDSYYGITLLGWELVKENTLSDYTELFDAGVVYRAK